jgi:hypothetical protein
MCFASVARKLRRGTLILLGTHIEMSLLIFRLVLTLVLHLELLLMLCLASFMDLTITHMVLVHERTTLFLDTLLMTYVLIVVIVSHVGMIFLLEGYTRLEPRHLDGPYFPHRCSRPTGLNGEVQKTVKTSDHVVKYWIPKIYLTNPNTELLTFSHPM